MHKSSLVALALGVVSCSRPGVTYLTCVVGDRTDQPWQFTLDEEKGTFDVNTGDLPSMSGKADFMAEQIRLTGNSGRPLFIIHRKDLTWAEFGGPPRGQCVRTDAPPQEI